MCSVMSRRMQRIRWKATAAVGRCAKICAAFQWAGEHRDDEMRKRYYFHHLKTVLTDCYVTGEVVITVFTGPLERTIRMVLRETIHKFRRFHWSLPRSTDSTVNENDVIDVLSYV